MMTMKKDSIESSGRARDIYLEVYILLYSITRCPPVTRAATGVPE